MTRPVGLPKQDVSGKRGRSGRLKASRLWWLIHQWCGLKLSLLLALVLLTGSLATLSHEIDWLLQPSMRVNPASVEQLRWDHIMQSAWQHPETENVESINAPIASAFAARVTIIRKNGQRAFLDIHPQTGQVQGIGPWVGAQRILRNMHRHLNMPTWLGVPIISALGFLLLVSFVTSFVIYKKWWRGFLKTPRTHNARTFWGDFHRLAGLWALWFLLLISLTSIWYFAESTGLEAPGLPKPEAPSAFRGDDVADPQNADATKLPDYVRHITQYIETAQQAMPGLRIQTIIPPKKAGDYLQIRGDYRAWLVRERANSIWIDPQSGKVALRADGRSLSVHSRISEMADPLHFGTFAGYWSKIIWFVFGLVLSALAISGVAIYSLRIAKGAAYQPVEEKQRQPSGKWRIYQAGQGRWKYLSILLIATGFALLPALIWQ